MADDPVTLDDVMGLLIANQKSTDAQFAEVREMLGAASEERQAIRDVVDNELAGQGQVMSLEGDLTEVKRSLRQLGKKVDAIGERLDRAKV